MKKKEKDLGSILGSLKLHELKKFIEYKSSIDEDFQRDFILFFSTNLLEQDLEKLYQDQVSKAFQKFSRRGLINYEDCKNYASEITQMLALSYENINRGYPRKAFIQAKSSLGLIFESMINSEDGGLVSETLSYCIGIFNELSILIDLPMALSQEIFDFLLFELLKEDYFEYGDFGFEMLSTAEALSIKIGKETQLIDYLNQQIQKHKSKNQEFLSNEFVQRKINFYRHIKKFEEADQLILSNLNVHQIRQDWIKNLKTKNKFSEARKQIEQGIKIAQKNNQSGIISLWERELFDLALLEKDNPNIRKWAKKLCFQGRFSVYYYQHWKKTYSKSEWKMAIQKEIEEITARLTIEFSKNRKNWGPNYEETILEKLGPIYIEEKDLDSLYGLLLKAPGLFNLLNYLKYFSKKHAQVMISLFIPALEKFSIEARDRNSYSALTGFFKEIIKEIPESKPEIIQLAKEIRVKFSIKPKRPAMLEILNKFLVQNEI